MAMAEAHDALESMNESVAMLRRSLKKVKTPRVRSREERLLIKSVCLTWFNKFRNVLAVILDDDLLEGSDNSFKALLTATDRETARASYDSELKSVQAALSVLRGEIVAPANKKVVLTVDTPPSFSSLVPDVRMQEILRRRWIECVTCVNAGAPLAATVMMGGLLEALLLARVHRETNKVAVFGAKGAPKDGGNKPLPLNHWTLRNYIDVAHELSWISSSAKDIGVVVRDYRNYIHPQKELSHGVVLNDDDAKLFWEVAKGITRQVLS